MIKICKYQIIVLHLYQQKQTIKFNIMKNLFKITDAKIIITLFTLAFAAFITIAVLNPGKQEIKPKTFVGIDAAGFKHYPDGHTERMEIKF